MGNPVSLSDRKEGMMSPLTVNLDDVASVLGKGEVALHFESGYSGNKNFPTFFSYRGMALEAVIEEIEKYKISPKTALSREHAAKIMRESSKYVSDTYVIELPGDVFIVYQLGIIRNLKGVQDNVQLSKKNIFQIIDDRDFRRGPYDKTGLRKPEWIGFDDSGRPLPKLNKIPLEETLPAFGVAPILPISGTYERYIDTSLMHDPSRHRIDTSGMGRLGESLIINNLTQNLKK